MSQTVHSSSILECVICLNTFDGKVHRPMMLPCCGQTICSTCVKSLHPNRQISKCPLCNQSIDLTQVVVNRIVCQIVTQPATLAVGANNESNKIKPSCCNAETCNIQGDSVFLSTWCKDCKRLVCHKCAEKFHLLHKQQSAETVSKDANRKYKLLLASVDKAVTQIDSVQHDTVIRASEVSKSTKSLIDDVNRFEQHLIYKAHEHASKLITHIKAESERAKLPLVVHFREINKQLEAMKQLSSDIRQHLEDFDLEKLSRIDATIHAVPKLDSASAKSARSFASLCFSTSDTKKLDSTCDATLTQWFSLKNKRSFTRLASTVCNKIANTFLDMLPYLLVVGVVVSAAAVVLYGAHILYQQHVPALCILFGIFCYFNFFVTN